MTRTILWNTDRDDRTTFAIDIAEVVAAFYVPPRSVRVHLRNVHVGVEVQVQDADAALRFVDDLRRGMCGPTTVQP